MIFENVIRAMLALSTLGMGGCQTPKPQGSDVRDAPAPSAEVIAGFTKCLGCHSNFKDAATGKASWPKLVAMADQVTSRINPANTGDERMPPADAAPNQQLSAALRSKMYDAIKIHAGAPPNGDQPSPQVQLPLERISLPPGFKISVYAVAKGARSLAMGPDGTLYIGTGVFSNPESKVYAARDHDGDHVAEDVVTILDQMNNPNGVAIRDGALYVAERFRVLKYPNIAQNLSSPGAPQVIWRQPVTNLMYHSWKYIAFGPDGKLYVPVGAPCNVCNPEAEPENGGPGLFARIFRMGPNGENPEVVARGVRNTVGFAWEPGTNDFYFTDNGRDGLGDNIPPDEINRVTTAEHFFGFPNCHGNGVKDPHYGPQGGCENFAFTRPVVALGAHVAALGMKFYSGSMFPPEYRQQIFVAEHGSWNSTSKVGARITWAKKGPNGQWSSSIFAKGWIIEDQDEFWGRPVDLWVAPDGALLVSDDLAGVVYRISYQGS